MNLFEFFDDINWLGVIIAILASQVWATIYFNEKVAGGVWGAATGVDMSDRTDIGPKVGLDVAMTAVLAISLALIAEATGSDDFGSGLVLGLVTGVGVFGARTLAGTRWENRSMNGWLIGFVGTLVAFLIIGVLVSVIN